jgi:hypothetical protein
MAILPLTNRIKSSKTTRKRRKYLIGMIKLKKLSLKIHFQGFLAYQ